MDAETAFHLVGNFGRYQWFLTILFFLGNCAYSLQMVLMVIVGATPNVTMENEKNLTTIVTDFDLYDKPWVVDLIQSLMMGGYMVGCMVFGQLSDIVGRWKILVIGGFLASIISICSGFTLSWQMFAVTHSIAGIFIGGSGIVMYVHLTELVGKNTWAGIGLMFQIFFSMGICLLAGIGYALQRWQTICFVAGGCAFAVIFSMFLFVPESPRWLYSTGKIEKAEAIMRKIAQRNGKDSRSIYLSPAEEHPSTHTVVDIFRHRRLLIWLLAMCFLWFGSGLIYYGLTLSAANLTSDLYLGVALSGLVEIPGTVVCIFLMDWKWFGRKKTVILLFLLCGLSNILLCFLMEYPTAKLVLGLTAKLAIAGAFNVVYVYACEIFPTPLRSVALGIVSTMARVGAIIAPFTPLMGSVHEFAPYLFFGIVSILALFLTLFLPRTLGKPVPQTIEEVVGENLYKSLITVNDNIQSASHGVAERGDITDYSEPRA